MSRVSPRLSEKWGDQVEDPAIRHFLRTASLLYGHGNFSAAGILRRVEDLEDADTRLFLIGQWCQGNARNEDAAEVVRAALQILMQRGLYVVQVRDLRELAAPLPFLSDLEELRRLVGEFDAVRASIELAAFEEDTALRLLLARAEMRYDSAAARDRLDDIYIATLDHQDIAVRAACLGRFVAALKEIDPGGELEEASKLHSIARDDLKQAFEELLSCTSEHYEATRSIIRALARTQPQLALEFVPSLNTLRRRDNALVDFVGAALDVPLVQLGPNLRQVETALGQIEDTNLRDFALVEAIKRLAALAHRDQSAFPLNKVTPLLTRINTISDLESRCIACCHAWLMQHDLKREGDVSQTTIEDVLALAWDNLDAQWEKVTAGFKIAGLLGECAPALATHYIQQAEQLRSQTVIENGVCAGAYMRCLHLSVRAFCGLLPRQLDTPDDLQQIYDVIDDLPSKTDRVRLFTDWALRCFLVQRKDLCHDIVDKRITPLINQLSNLKAEYQHQAILFAAPALYVRHHETASGRIESLPIMLRDGALERICRFILTKKAPFDPIEPAPDFNFSITSEDAQEICSLLEKVDHDHIVYRYMVEIIDSATSSRTVINKAQKALLAENLENLAARKFPAQRHIRHDGFVVAAHAQLARLRVPQRDTWQRLRQQAASIANKADIAFVLGIVGNAMAYMGASEADKKSIFAQAEEVVESIPLLMDRADHYGCLMELARDDKTLRELYASKVLQIAVEVHHPKSRALQNQVIDYIHRYDPKKAAEMASQADGDPARENLRKRVEMLDFKNNLVKERLDAQAFADAKRQHCVNAAWIALGQLNSGYSRHCHHEKLNPYIEISAGGAMKDAYCILSYVIENAVSRHASTDHAREILRPLFDAMMQGTQMSLQMAQRQTRKAERVRHNAPGASGAAPGDTLIIENGERQKAVEFLSTWLSDEASGFVKICDPYLGPQDVCDILLLVQERNPDLKVKFLLGQEGFSADQLRGLRAALIDQWVRVCGQNPPDTKVALCYTRVTKKFPVHDRWWLTENGGLYLGTSFNGLGHRISNILRLCAIDAQQNERIVDSYLDGREEWYEGEALRHEAFPLDLD